MAIGSDGSVGWRVVRHWLSHSPSTTPATATARSPIGRAGPQGQAEVVDGLLEQHRQPGHPVRFSSRLGPAIASLQSPYGTALSHSTHSAA